jgi:uncharacterized protein
VNQIIPCGSFLELDAEGYLRNTTRRELVPAGFQPLMDDLVLRYRQLVGPALVAVYLRGSLARGQAMPPISDVDVVGILEHRPDEEFMRWAKPTWAGVEEARLLKRHPDAGKIDFAIGHRDPEFPGRNAMVKFVLATQGLCLWGVDESPSWPRFKPTRAIAFFYRWLPEEWQEWQTQWQDQAASVEKTAFLQSFAKTALRAGFELVMEREGSYTVDLYPCYTAFARHYPALASAMEAALISYLNPTLDDAAHKTWMAVLLPFLIAECGKYLAL